MLLRRKNRKFCNKVHYLIMLLVNVYICWNRVDTARQPSFRQVKLTTSLIAIRIIHYCRPISTSSRNLPIKSITAITPIKKGPDGRKFHMSNTGVDPMVESSESEEGLPSPPPVTTGSVAFSNVLDEAKAGTQNIESTAEARYHNTAAGRNRFGPDLPAQVVIHNWIPETHPAGATEAHATLEECIKQKRDNLLRATVKVCKTGHVVLVVWWTPSDPLNRKGTWSLEVFDCRFELWGESGIEAHEQCELSTANDIVKTLAKTMVEKWQTVLSADEANPDPICEWNKDKRKLQDDKYNRRSLPSLREVERELRPLAVYALNRVSRAQGEESRGDQTDEDENDKEKERYNWPI
jgi:hypothetical protein